MNLKKTATLMFLILVSSMTFALLNPTSAQTNDEQKQKAEALLNILYNGNSSVIEAFNRLEAQNTSVPPIAETKYNEALTQGEEAVSLMNQEKFSEASSEAVEAMQKFEETLRILEDTSPVEPTETQATAEKTINLKAAITRAFEHLERLENITTLAKAKGYNTTRIEKKISEVTIHLVDALDQLDSRNLDGAAEALRKARTSLDELDALFDRLVNLVKVSNTEKYLEEAEIRVSATKENITLSTSLSPQNRTNAITALNNSETNLANARDYIEQSKVDDAITELEEAKKWEDESRKYLTPTAVSTNSVDAVDKSLTRIEPTISK